MTAIWTRVYRPGRLPRFDQERDITRATLREGLERATEGGSVLQAADERDHFPKCIRTSNFSGWTSFANYS
jgi:hypothetical protein